jgi:HK97 family phage portal protein
MGIAEAVGQLVGRFEAARQRAFVLGAGVVDPYEKAYGHDSSEFAPEEYGNYIATSGAVYSCIDLRARLFKRRKLKVFKLDSAGDRVEVTTGNLVKLLKKVNPFWTMTRMLDMSEKSLGLWGQNFWFCERGESGKLPPREIWWGRPDRVRIVPDEVNYINKFLYYPANSPTPLEFDPWEVIWFRYANPLDEYAGLSPLAAARIAADLRSSAFLSNKKLFDQGMQLGGAITPPKGSTLGKPEAQEIEQTINKRFSGVDKAHRWAVFRYEFEMQQMGINAKDAEFLGTINLTLEEVARAYGVPLDLLGGQRTYANVEASQKAIWEQTLIPECEDFSDELTEQLVPMFGGEADLVEFDTDDIAVLHESEGAAWERDKGKIDSGAITINEWRTEQGMEAVPWGNVWWAPGTLMPVSSSEEADSGQLTAGEGNVNSNEGSVNSDLLAGAGEEDGSQLTENGSRHLAQTRAWKGMAYGGEEHARAWRAFERKSQKWQKRTGEMVRDLFRRQLESVIARMGDQRAMRSAEEAAGDPFNRKEWVRKFRIEMRALLEDLLDEVGDDALDELALGKAGMAFDVKAPAVRRFMEQRAQRFAQEVNETTWNLLRDSLSEGLGAGEGLQEMMLRVERVMGERIRSSSETIARTEAIGAMNGGKVEAWKQAEAQLDGMRVRKAWLAELDDRTRESHVEAHQRYQGQPIGMDEDFEVGGGAGPAPGQLGEPEEDINCRCTVQPVVEEEE